MKVIIWRLTRAPWIRSWACKENHWNAKWVEMTQTVILKLLTVYYTTTLAVSIKLLDDLHLIKSL